MTEFEQRLSECLEALIQGRLTVDECLGMYPQHADALRPHLIAATAFARTADEQPNAEWATKARQRFLIASGKSLQEAMDIEPEPTFFASARVRFLLAAQKLRQERTAAKPRRMPVFGTPMRAVGALAASVALFVGFSGYTVQSADAALPGDWRYPIKLQTERVRLAVAITDDQKREVKLDIAEERIEEIEALASKGKIIGPGVLNRYVAQTQPLVEDANDGKLDDGDAARLQQVAIRGTQVLDQVEEQIAPDAEEKLAEAKVVSDTGVTVTRELVVKDPDRPNIVITPQIPVVTATPEPTEDPPTEEPGAETPTPEPTDVPPTEDPEATPTEVTPGEIPTDDVVMSELPIVDYDDIKLHTLTAGRLTLRAPGPSTGWYLDGVPASGVPVLITMKTQNQQSFIVLNTLNGDMYWYVSAAGNNRFDEIQMRQTRDGQVFQADPAVLRYFYGDAAEIPLLVMNSIRILPEPSPTPEPTATLEAEPTPPR